MHPNSEASWQRHQLVRLAPSAWQRVIAMPFDEGAREWLSDWAAFDWPLVVRRALAHETQGVGLGIPLPPSAGKRRLAITVSASEIVSTRGLPSLRDVSAAAPTPWRKMLPLLDALAQRFDVNAGVFGSLAWQCLTGRRYVTQDSDLDIAWEMPHPAVLKAFLDELAQLEAHAPMRLDGELIRKDGAAVNWREIWRGDHALAVKTYAAVADCSLERFLRDAA